MKPPLIPRNNSGRVAMCGPALSFILDIREIRNGPRDHFALDGIGIPSWSMIAPIAK